MNNLNSPAKPRIYVAITTFHPLIGGAERQTLAQCQQLREMGYEVQVVTFRHDYRWPKREVIAGVPVMRIAGLFLGRREKMPRFCQRLLYFLAMIAMSWRFWREQRNYDILQVCLLSQLVLPLAIVCWLTRKPMLIVLISAGSKQLSGKMMISGHLDPETPWLRIEGNHSARGDIDVLKSSGKLVFNLTRYLLRKIKASFVVLSTNMLLALKENDFCLPGTQLIPNGVDITRFHPLAADIANDEQRHKTVICVCRLTYVKGIDVLLQAWHLVMKEAPAGTRLLIVGIGPLQKKLELLAQALQISESVEFLGAQEDVPQQLHRGSIAVLPSRTEGMPNALLEAMACGCACIATRVSGSEDLIQHGENGLLVEIEDYQAMAQAILTLLHDSALAAQYGKAARKTIEEQYTLEKITRSYIGLYHKMIKKWK